MTFLRKHHSFNTMTTKTDDRQELTKMSRTPSSSKIILNCSSNFSSLRIESIKRDNQNEDEDETIVAVKQSIPKINKLFTILSKVGEGTFSKVFHGKYIKNEKKEYALKCIIPTTKPSRIASELRFLRDLDGQSNVVPVKMCLFGNGYTVIVMPYFKHDSFIDYVRHLNSNEIKEYLENLLIALKHVHDLGIIHRDIKPSNFLFNRIEKKYLLVDFGLAQKESDLMRNSIKLKMNTKCTTPTKDKNTHLSSTPLPPIASTSMQSKNCSQQILKDTTKTTVNNVITSQNSKLLLIRKRSRTEFEKNKTKTLINNSNKRIKLNDNLYKPSVFDTPDSPYGEMSKSIEISPICMTPVKKGLFKENFLTPDLTPNQIIPETPQKVLRNKKINHEQISKISNEENVIKKPKIIEKKHENLLETPKTKSSKKPSPKKQQILECNCYTKPQICEICLKRSELLAPRAGTPGFRAPEVLLRHLHQTTAIDIWSVGVIFASLLSTRYPFFRNTDDLTALAEIITIFGTKRIMKTASDLGKNLLVSVKYKPSVTLKVLCEKLRKDDNFLIDETAYDLLEKLLEPNPNLRITAEKALQHSFFIKKL